MEKTTAKWKKPARNARQRRCIAFRAGKLHFSLVNCISQQKKTENQSIVHVNIVNRPGTVEKPKTAGE